MSLLLSVSPFRFTSSLEKLGRITNQGLIDGKIPSLSFHFPQSPLETGLSNRRCCLHARIDHKLKPWRDLKLYLHRQFDHLCNQHSLDNPEVKFQRNAWLIHKAKIELQSSLWGFLEALCWVCSYCWHASENQMKLHFSGILGQGCKGAEKMQCTSHMAEKFLMLLVYEDSKKTW